MIRIKKIVSIGTPREWLKRGFAATFVKPVLQRAILLWHSKMLPRHFAPGAAGRYRYRGRTSYTRYRKQKAAGSARFSPEARLPLIWTGRLKKEVSQMIRVSGTGKRAWGVMRGPPHLIYRPWMAEEITKVTQKEADELANYILHQVVHRVNNFREKTVTRFT